VNSPEVKARSEEFTEKFTNSHDGSFARAVPTKQTRHFTLAELQRKIIHGYNIPPLAVVNLPNAVEFHSDLLLGDRQAAGVAVVIYVRQDMTRSSDQMMCLCNASSYQFLFTVTPSEKAYKLFLKRSSLAAPGEDANDLLPASKVINNYSMLSNRNTPREQTMLLTAQLHSLLYAQHVHCKYCKRTSPQDIIATKTSASCRDIKTR